MRAGVKKNFYGMVVVCTIPSGSGGAVCSGNCVKTFYSECKWWTASFQVKGGLKIAFSSILSAFIR